jgi:hypothetical protein
MKRHYTLLRITLRSLLIDIYQHNVGIYGNKKTVVIPSRGMDAPYRRKKSGGRKWGDPEYQYSTQTELIHHH